MSEKPAMTVEGRCRGCNAKIVWGVLAGKPHPFNTDAGGSSHFASCPKAMDFRKPKIKPVSDVGHENKLLF